jgi:hypothetical protein
MDMASDAWTGPPEGALGWWKCRVPETRRGAPKPAPAHILLSALESLLEDGNQAILAYLLALLLVRRRIQTETSLLFAESSDHEVPGSDDAGSDDASAPNLLHLIHPPSQREFLVPVCEPALDTCQAYHDQFTRLLFSEQ